MENDLAMDLVRNLIQATAAGVDSVWK